MTAARDPLCWSVHPGKTCSRTAPGGSCPPRVCWCGSCPWWRPGSYTPHAETVLDSKARDSGRRASGERRKRARGEPS